MRSLFPMTLENPELLPRAGADCPARRRLTKTKEEGTIIINRSGRSTYPEEKSVSRSGASPFYRAKFRFQNPIHQNDGHVRAIQELVEFLPADAIRSAVVFTGNAEFKTAIPEGVFTLEGFLAYVERHAAEVMSINRVQFCVGRLETARLSITKTTDVEHVEGLRRRYGNDE